MNKAVKLKRPGSIDQMEMVDWPPQEPGPGEVRIRHETIGVNFIDIYFRSGLYPLPAPGILGVEGVGTIEALGDDVNDAKVGQRIVYTALPGAYAATRLLPAWRAIALPDTISSHIAAASMLRGMTVHMLLRCTYPVSKESVLLVHAAAGGLGSMLTRWAKYLGATVIGAVGSPEKASAARSNGADHVIVGRDAEIVDEVAKLTMGRGVDFAVDGIGGKMLRKTLACARPLGTVASIGQAAGPIPPLTIEEFAPLRAICFSRPSIMSYASDKDIYRDAAKEVLAMIQRNITAGIGREYRLDQAAEAHVDLETGRMVGAAIIAI